MKKIENIVCFLISIAILITYIIAMNKINNTILYLIANVVCLIMITANLLLYKCLQNRREQNDNNN